MAAGRGNRTLALLDPPGRDDRARAASGMRFRPEDEAGYEACVRPLTEEFARWVRKHGVAVDASDGEMLLDWRFRYHDGVLDSWRVADVSEFLLRWCPRKLSARPEDCASLPLAVASFVDFLAHTGRLSPPSDPPSVIRRWCENERPAFLREMANPANFGMAKSFFAQAGGLELGVAPSAGDLSALVSRANRLDPAAVGGVLDRVARQAANVPTEVAPVRLPADEQYRMAVAAEPFLARLRGLAAYCAKPGVTLTGKGNLRLADARRLVETLDTGDVVPAGLRSSEDLPGLSRLVAVAIAAGAVRRHDGRLVAVARFAGLDDVPAYEKALRVALSLPAFSVPGHFAILRQIHEFVAASLPLVLAEVLDAGSGGAEDADVVDLLGALVVARFPGSDSTAELFVPMWAERMIDDLLDLGMVAAWLDDESCGECDGGHTFLALTAAGLPTAVEIVREAGIAVPLRPSPATGSADDIADLVGIGLREDWCADAGDWLEAQPDRAAAARELLRAVATPERPTVAVMFAIEEVAELAGGGAEGHALVRTLMGGPHDGIALVWLLNQGALAPGEVDRNRMVAGLIDMLALTLDAAGPAHLVDQFLELHHAEQADLLDNLWRMDHPRLAEILDVLGSPGNPDKAMAKLARRCVVKLRTRRGQERALRSDGAPRTDGN